MLNNITIKNVASYGDTEQKLTDLNVVNFIFGDNGSGKSTIARLIEDDQQPDFNSCQLSWGDAGPVQRLVYNHKFIDDTLREKVKGVFTFGDQAGVKQDELDLKIEERKKEEEKLKRLREQLKVKNGDRDTELNRFINKCWTLKTEYANTFDVAFKGVMSKKELFMQKCLANVEIQHAESLDDLLKQTKIFFNDQPDKIDLLPTMAPDNLELIETNEIFKLKIIGKEDVPISELIKVLGNSDWVRQGISYLESGELCPFCQQQLPDSLRKDFEDYFDETFDKKMQVLNNAASDYAARFSAQLRHYDSLSQCENDFFSFNQIKEKIALIRTKFGKNQDFLGRKLREPSLSIELVPLADSVAELASIVAKANSEIEAFNLRIDNFGAERGELIRKVWAYIGSQAKVFYQDHLDILNPIISAITGMERREEAIKGRMESLDTAISEIEKDLISTAPSKEGINNILKSFGFDGFKLENEGEGYYRIVRADGSLAQETLSEGERTFITFLYFYQLIQGSTSKDEVREPRIVVFDDPVSSLDSKILFIVSTLIRGLFNSETLAQLNITQLILLTHNVYFHKEVSFVPGLKSLGAAHLKESDFKYWVIRKQDGVSRLLPFEKNPIKTSYQLLWQEVKRCEEDHSVSVNICNTLRRILENYFKVLGGIDLAGLTDKFEGNEKFVCRSLTSWVHDGSHCLYDGIELGFGQDLTDLYLPVFKKIFEQTHHESHYEMMMSSCE